jgi:hypothetical protein
MFATMLGFAAGLSVGVACVDLVVDSTVRGLTTHTALECSVAVLLVALTIKVKQGGQ